MRSVILLLLCICALESAKIALFVFPMSNSHVIFTNHVAEELARDHEVVIIRPNANPKASKIVSKHPKVREFRTPGISLETFESFTKDEFDFIWSNKPWYENMGMLFGYKKMVEEMCTDFVNNPKDFIQQLREEKFDLAIGHHLETCHLSVIKAAGIPQFGYILSTPLIPTHVHFTGIPVMPSIFPNQMIDTDNEMEFVPRFKNFLLDVLAKSVGRYMQGYSIDRIFRARFGPDFPSNAETMLEARFLLANVNPDVEFPIPVTSKVTYFGGLGMSNETKALEEPYASFVQKAKKVVFVSFGTVADPKIMPLSWKEAFVELFEKNPSISFIWRMDDAVVVPKNVLRSMWHPQKDLLAHPKVAAFITHAGYNSLSESMASGTPLITVPLFADQFRNSRLAMHRGFGVRVEKTEVTFETLNGALQTILSDPSFERSAQQMRRIVFSQPVQAGDALRHAVNFALENPDYNRDIPSLPFWKFYSLDMIFLVFVLPLCIPILFKWYVWSCCKMANKEKEKMN